MTLRKVFGAMAIWQLAVCAMPSLAEDLAQAARQQYDQQSPITMATTVEDTFSLVSQNGASQMTRKVSTTIPDPPDGYKALLAASNPVLVKTEKTIDQLAAAVKRNVRAVWQARVDTVATTDEQTAYVQQLAESREGVLFDQFRTQVVALRDAALKRARGGHELLSQFFRRAALRPSAHPRVASLSQHYRGNEKPVGMEIFFTQRFGVLINGLLGSAV